MKHLMYDLRFILRNWRFFHFHGVLWTELREWWADYDPPLPDTHIDYSINLPRGEV